MKRLSKCAALLLLAPAATEAACTVSVPTMAFGTYNPTSATPRDISASVTVTCSSAAGSTNHVISLSDGGGTGYTARRMNVGGLLLPYQLYTSSARTIVWGDGTSGTGTQSFFGANGTFIFTIHGRIAARQFASPSTGYIDPVVATLTY